MEGSSGPRGLLIRERAEQGCLRHQHAQLGLEGLLAFPTSPPGVHLGTLYLHLVFQVLHDKTKIHPLGGGFRKLLPRSLYVRCQRPPTLCAGIAGEYLSTYQRLRLSLTQPPIWECSFTSGSMLSWRDSSLIRLWHLSTSPPPFLFCVLAFPPDFYYACSSPALRLFARSSKTAGSTLSGNTLQSPKYRLRKCAFSGLPDQQNGSYELG